MADVEFFWDPICPFAWITSRWVTTVAEERDLSVEWRFICLRLLNEGRDYDEFPDGYSELHTNGLRMLRVASAARQEHGSDAMGPLYTAYGESIWNRQPGEGMRGVGSPEHLRAALETAGRPEDLAAASEDASHDAGLRTETEEALARTGDDVGTPIITFQPPDGVSFFGPVISRVPETPARACELWDAVLELASWPGFAEIKRSARETPQLPLLSRLG